MKIEKCFETKERIENEPRKVVRKKLTDRVWEEKYEMHYKELK